MHNSRLTPGLAAPLLHLLGANGMRKASVSLAARLKRRRRLTSGLEVLYRQCSQRQAAIWIMLGPVEVVCLISILQKELIRFAYQFCQFPNFYSEALCRPF